MLGYASATARRVPIVIAARLIDRFSAGEPVRKLLFVEMFRDTRLPMA
jgi:hypothetical protein